jgi:glycine oxidase
LEIHTNAPDVVIVGGGVIGLAVGWRAAQRGLRVSLLERGEPGAATSRVAAGMIAPIAEAAPREQALLGLALRSAHDYPLFVAELREAAGIDPGYLECGTLFVARDADEAEALKREQAMRESLGLRVRRVSASQARRLEPALAPSLRAALEFVDDCAIDPRRLTAALVEAFRRAGGTLRTGVEVAELVCAEDPRGVRVRGVRLSGGELLPARQVVLAAGPWSAQLPGVPAHARIPIRPVKGQILRLRDPSGPGLLTRVLRMQPGYLVPRGDGRYVLGASVEERGFDTTVTAGPVFELLRDAIELVPGLGELVIEELLAGIRPGTPDNKPLLGPGAVPGLHWATGHYRHGILLAPITAEILADALTGGQPTELARECAPGRFDRVTVGT